MQTLVGVVMGSRSEWQTIKHVSNTLADMSVRHDVRIVSARRTSDQLKKYAKSAEERGIKLIVASAQFDAHLPGLLAAHTSIPVLAVGVEPGSVHVKDVVQDIEKMHDEMSGEVVDSGCTGAVHVALLAATALATEHDEVRRALVDFHTRQFTEEPGAMSLPLAM